MASDIDKTLKDLFASRLRDKRQSRTRRRIRLEARPEALGNILSGCFPHNPQILKKIEETRALLAWEKYVGESAAAQSQAVRLRKGTLTVQVNNPIWMQQLYLLKERILKLYRKDFPNLQIQNIFFTQQA